MDKIRAAGSDSAYYDRDGRIYYKGKDVIDVDRHGASTSAASSSHGPPRHHTSLPPMSRVNPRHPSSSPKSQHSHYQRPVTTKSRVQTLNEQLRDEIRRYGKHPPLRHTRSYDADKMTSPASAHRHNGGYALDRTRSRSIDMDFEKDLAARGYRIVRDDSNKSHATAKRKLYNHNHHGYGSYDRRHDADRYSTDSSPLYAQHGRPLPRPPIDGYRNDHNTSRDGSWFEMEGYTHTLPGEAKDKDILFHNNSHFDDDIAPYRDNVMSYYVPFIVFGLFLAACGVMNLLFCDEFQYYFRFWVAILVFEAGLFGALHRGNYKSGWKTFLFIGSCFIATVATFVGFALLMNHLIDETIDIADAHNLSEYVRLNVPDDTYSNVKNDDVVVWLCYTFDWACVILLLCSITTLSVGVMVLDKYWIANYYYTQVSEAFCHPPFFNPFGQMQVGQVMVLFGILTVYGCTDSDWMDYWSPVGAGALCIVAGLVSGLAMKRHDLCSWSFVSLLCQLLAAGATVTAIALCVMGMIKNVDAMSKKQSSLDEDLSITSATIYAATIAICLINVFFSFAQMVRVCTYMCAPSKTRRRRRLSNVGSFGTFSDIGYPHHNSAQYRAHAQPHNRSAGSYYSDRSIDRTRYTPQSERTLFGRI